MVALINCISCRDDFNLNIWGEKIINPFELSEHAVLREDQQLKYYIRTPQKLRSIEARLLLITVSTEWEPALLKLPHCITADKFVANGHLALSFDPPCHGERTGPYGEGIHGLCHALQNGADPFELFVHDAQAILDDCIEKGIVRPDRIVACGVSRGAYMALRLIAADSRIARGAGFAPVTDWRFLQEFEKMKDSEMLLLRRLHRFIDGLAGKPLFMAIGHSDDRVGTVSCCKLYTELQDCNLARGYDQSTIDFYITEDEDHSMGDKWYEKGAQFLLSGYGTL